MTKREFIPPNTVKTKIEAFASRSGLSIASVCKLSCGNWRLHQQMEKTGECRQVTARRVLEYIEANKDRTRLRASPVSEQVAGVDA